MTSFTLLQCSSENDKRIYFTPWQRSSENDISQSPQTHWLQDGSCALIPCQKEAIIEKTRIAGEHIIYIYSCEIYIHGERQL